MSGLQDRRLTDLPDDGQRAHFEGSLAYPQGYWATYNAERREWVRDK